MAVLKISPDGEWMLPSWRFSQREGKKLASVLEDGYDVSVWDLENLKKFKMKPEYTFRRSMSDEIYKISLSLTHR